MRRTGRTTRMMEHAAKLASEGRAVYVVVANAKAVAEIRSRFQDLIGAFGSGIMIDGIQIETEETLGNLHWDTLTLLGAHPNCVVLVDHYAIEIKYAKVLDMLHRYDAEPER